MDPLLQPLAAAEPSSNAHTCQRSFKKTTDHKKSTSVGSDRFKTRTDPRVVEAIAIPGPLPPDLSNPPTKGRLISLYPAPPGVLLEFTFF